jgi:hypothetical protein
MKPVLMLACLLTVTVASPLARAEAKIPFFHRHKANATKPEKAEKTKTKRSLFHRGEPTREENARAEAAYGMTGPKTVGFWHKEPGPAGVGAE